MDKNNRIEDQGIFTKKTTLDLFFYGTLMGILTLVNFIITQYAFHENLRHGQTISFMTLVLLFLTHSYNARTGDKPFWSEDFIYSKNLHFSVLFGVGTLLLTLYVPFLRDTIFHQETPKWQDWLLSLGASIIYMVISEMYKLSRRGNITPNNLLFQC